MLILLRVSIMRQCYTPLYTHVRRLYAALIFRVYICAFLVTRLYPLVSIYYTSVSARFYLRIVFTFVSVDLYYAFVFARLYQHVYTYALYLRVSCTCGFILRVGFTRMMCLCFVYAHAPRFTITVTY